MRRTGLIVLTVLVFLGVLLRGVGLSLVHDMASQKPDRPAGPLEIAAHELSLPDPRGAERWPIAVRVWLPQAAEAARAYPLIIYVPSWGGSRGESDVLLSDIASAGFVVAAADDISRDPPDPAIDPADEAVRTAPFRAFSAKDLAAFPEVSKRRTQLGYNKLTRVLMALTRLPSNALPSTIDVSRIGVVGFSFGGAVAAVTLARDPRVAAAVNLDGWVIDTPAAAGLSRPLLALYAKLGLHPLPAWVSAPDYYVTELARDDFRTLLALSRSSGADVRLIDGVEHQDFADALYDASRWKRWRPWRRNVIRPDRMRTIVEAYLMPFLLRHVSGQPSNAPNYPVFSEVTSIEAIEGDLR